MAQKRTAIRLHSLSAIVFGSVLHLQTREDIFEQCGMNAELNGFANYSYDCYVKNKHRTHYLHLFAGPGP